MEVGTMGEVDFISYLMYLIQLICILYCIRYGHAVLREKPSDIWANV